MAAAAVWANRLANLHARALKPYGQVQPELAGGLAPKLDELVGLLEKLAEAGQRLPR